MLWKIGSSFRKTTLLPTGTTNTCGRNALLRWVITLPRAGAGRGVSPPTRLSQTTAPPGPCAPPPDTVPLTLAVGGGGGATAAASRAAGADPTGAAAPAATSAADIAG